MEQQTRRWDEDTLSTIYMRGKVDAIDYKYFVEPNIPKIKLSKSWLEEIKKQIPILAPERKEKYIKDYGLTEYDAKIIVKEKAIADFYEETINKGANPKLASNWLTTNILGYLNKYDLNIKDIYLTPQMLVDLIKMIEDGKISTKQSKEILVKIIEDKKEPKTIVKDLGITQITDETELLKIITEVIKENQHQVEQYKNQPRVLDYFIGQTMKKTRGKANPSLTSKLLKQELDKQ